MKRKLTTILLTAAVLLTLIVPAFADVMWEPYGNTFYESHWDEMSYMNRGYLANGEKGYITVLTAPDSLVEVTNLPNGTYFNVGMTWEDKDGILWGVGYHYRYAGEVTEHYEGWVPMSELALIYDDEAFSEDHSAEFAEYDGSGNHLTEVCLYSYPGGQYNFTVKESEDYMPFDEAFTHLYTDENGLRWTYIGYYMGRLNSWVCIDDPLNEKLGTDGYLTVGQVRENEEPIPAEAAPGAKTWVVWVIPAALVVLAAVTTALILRKKRKA